MKNSIFHPCPCNRIYCPWAIDSQTNRNRFFSFFDLEDENMFCTLLSCSQHKGLYLQGNQWFDSW